MISVSGQLTDQLRDIKDLTSSLLMYLRNPINFFLRHAKNQLSYIRRLVEDSNFVKRKEECCLCFKERVSGLSMLEGLAGHGPVRFSFLKPSPPKALD
jgi:hypothetical protein